MTLGVPTEDRKYAGWNRFFIGVISVAVAVLLGVLIFVERDIRRHELPEVPTIADAEAAAATHLEAEEHPGFEARCTTPSLWEKWTCRARDAAGSYGWVRFDPEIREVRVEQQRRRLGRPRSVYYEQRLFTERSGRWAVDGEGWVVFDGRPAYPRSVGDRYRAQPDVSHVLSDARFALGLSGTSQESIPDNFLCPDLQVPGAATCLATDGVTEARVEVDVDRLHIVFRLDMPRILAEMEAKGVAW